jgi:hypothetical protein
MRMRRLILTVLTAMAMFFAIQMPGAAPASAAATTIEDTAIGTGTNQVQYTGSSWVHCGGCSVATDNSSYYYGLTVGDSYTLRFTGTQLTVYAPTDTSGGIANVTVDGSSAGTVDFHTTGTPTNGVRWTSATLSSAAHTVVFTISSSTNSSGHVVLFDKAVVASSGGSFATSQLIGAGVADPYEFGTWLGRSLQVWETWNNYPDWTTMQGIPSVHQYFTGEGTAPFNKRWTGLLSFSQPLFAQTETTANCSAGGDDSHYTAIANALKNAGFGNAIIRLGWEQNGDWFWWHATSSNASAWVSCFQHAYNAFKAVSPSFVMEWNPNKSTDMSGFDTRTTYPGDAYVDAIGVDFYDQFPAYPDESTWDAHYSDTESGGSPTGMGSWISYAESHGKQIAFPEWGLDTVNDTTNPDNAFFVNTMASTFSGLGTELFEQSIFTLTANPTCTFAIHVDNCNPNAAAAYQAQFG